MSTELHWQDATEIARRIREGEISAVDALEHFLARVDRLNPQFNCIVVLDAGRARARAAEADAALARGESWGPLHGVPMTVKDTFEIEGLLTAVGAEFLKDYVSPRTATTVKRLLDAGAIIFGKTNVPPMAADLQTRNEVYGITRNPWNPERIAGGSSGGSAAALAAGLTPLELGSDIGGSSRNPAHYNNVFGMRPSWGTISGIGHIPGLPGALMNDEFGTPGPMARSARDLRLAFDIVRGSDPAFGHELRPELPEQAIEDVSKLRVAVWIDDDIVPVDASVRKVLDEALAKLRAGGVTDLTEAKPDFDLREGYDLYIRMGGAITGQDTPPEERDALIKQIAEAADDETRRDLNRSRGVVMSFAEWCSDSKLRGKIRAKWTEFFKQYDVLLSPIMSVAALPHDINFFVRPIEINGETHIGGDQLYWSAHQVVANLPSVVFPAGFTEEKLPVGFQLTAPYLEDYRAIRVAGLFADLVGVHDRHPPLAA
jgi:amidase